MTDKPDVAELVKRLRKLQSTAYGTVRMLQDKRKLVVNNHVVADTTGDTTIEFATALLQNAPVILDALTTLSRRNAELEAERTELRQLLHDVRLEASETIPPDGKAAAFAALHRICLMISTRAALGGSPDEA